jgi:predicted HTH domain antitoxin
MTITVELPADLNEHANPAREALEAFVIECYRNETLYPRACRELLGMGRFEFEGLLKERGVMEGAYSVEDLRSDFVTMDCLRAEGVLGK